MTGLKKFEGKDKRRQRMRNHIAKDLRDNKYRQRILPDRRKKHLDEDERYFYFDEDE